MGFSVGTCALDAQFRRHATRVLLGDYDFQFGTHFVVPRKSLEGSLIVAKIVMRHRARKQHSRTGIRLVVTIENVESPIGVLERNSRPPEGQGRLRETDLCVRDAQFVINALNLGQSALEGGIRRGRLSSHQEMLS
jgi:hypothetical protein